MPTARELLEQADALMRRNRSTAADDIPVLTDSVALPSGQPIPVVTPAYAGHAEIESAAQAVPVLTESVEVIEDDADGPPADVDVDVVAEGEPSDWLEFERGEPSAIGEAPDSIVIVPSVLRATPRGEAAVKSDAPDAFEEIEITTPAEAEFDEEFDEVAQHDAPAVADLHVDDQAAAVAMARADAPSLPSVEDGVADDAYPEAGEPAGFADADGRGNRDDPTADREFAATQEGEAPVTHAVGDDPGARTDHEHLADRIRRDDPALRSEGDERIDDADAYAERVGSDDRVAVVGREEIADRVDVVEPDAPVVHLDRGDDDGEPRAGGDARHEPTPQMAEGHDAMIAMSVPSSGAPGVALQATAFRMASDGAGAASVPYAIAFAAAAAPPPAPPPAPEAPAPVPDAAAQVAAQAALQAAEQAKWDSLAEEVRMQVLQRIDLFTDTGLRDQLALRLQPIVDRASADLVATINQHIGLLLRGYVAEAIEREIENWRRNQ